MTEQVIALDAGRLSVDVAEYVARHDVVFLSPGAEGWEGPFNAPINRDANPAPPTRNGQRPFVTVPRFAGQADPFRPLRPTWRCSCVRYPKVAEEPVP